MKTQAYLSWILALTLATAWPVAAEETNAREGSEKKDAEAEPTEDQEITRQESKPLPIYIPSSRGATKTRVGAATRGQRTDFPALDALAPDHVGITSQAQPTLCWHLAAESNTRIDVTLIDDKSVKPMLELTLSAPVQAGVRTLRLPDHGLRLEPDKVYQWFVALVPDPQRRSNDIIASGAIERRDPPEALRRELAATDPSRAYEVLARHGVWYDAIAGLSDQIKADPENGNLRAARAALLEQIGLERAAERERSPGGLGS
jgi:hypothetical protein